MINASLHSELASWTSRVLQARTAGSPVVGAPGAAGRAGEPSTATMLTVASALRRAACRLNQRHPICNLPRPVILRLCSYLDTPETLLLSHTSRGVRNALLGVPELWSSVPIISEDVWLQDNALARTILTTFLERSDPLPFDASLVLSGSKVSEQVSLLARNMHRMAALRFLCVDNDPTTPAQSWPSLLRLVFSEPAPQLETLHIFHSPFFYEFRPSAFQPLVLGDVFRASAPSLRRVKLSLVRLPATLDYPAFQNTTIFINDIFGITTAADLQVLSQMPRLQIFQWGGVVELDLGDAAIDAVAAASCPRSLHTVLLSFRNDFDAVGLRGVLPVQQLRELWITTPTHDTCGTIPSIYDQSTVQGAGLGCSSTGAVALLHVVHPGESGATSVLFNPRHVPTLVSSLLTPFTSITWLTIHDYLWDNEMTGTPPVLPAVATLSVCLASSEDYANEWRGSWSFSHGSAGVFTADPACRWPLPALREVRPTSSPNAERGPDPDEESNISVSLDDIARWVRDSIAVEPSARKLDAVVLSGVRIIDHDFCAAWDAIIALSHSLELSAEPDMLHHTSSADMDFRIRSSSFADDSRHIFN